MRIVIIIPTYNEVENIGQMLDVLIKKVLPQIRTHQMRILVVDDNSPDGTAKVVRKKMTIYNRQEKVIYLLTGPKKGIGDAYARGMKYAMHKLGADAIIEMDADFQHNPYDIPRLIAEFDKGADFVIGSRYVKGGSIPKEWNFYRRFLSWAGNIFARIVLLLRIHDVTSGFKLTRVHGFLDKIDLDNLISYDYAYKIQILYELIKDRLARAKEIPVNFHFRERGSSKLETKDIRESLKVVIILFFRSRFFKFGIVGFIGFLINAVSLELFSNAGFTQRLADLFLFLSDKRFLMIATQPSAWAASLAAELAILSNFTLNNFWTFAKEKITQPKKIVKRFLEFNLTSGGAILIQFVVIGSAVTLFGDTSAVRQIALVFSVVFLIVPYNYTMYNVFIWRRWRVPWLSFLYDKEQKMRG